MPPELDSLTPAEREALSLAADGHTSKEIARRLGVSASAVNQRIDGARRKLGDISRAEAARLWRSWSSDRVTGDPVRVAAEPWPDPLPTQQPEGLQVSEPAAIFEHARPRPATEPDHDLTSLIRILKTAAILAGLILGLILIALTVMRTVNEMGLPLLNIIQ